MFLLFSMVAAAADVPIDSGEFRDTAESTPAGRWVIHPLMRSNYGITDQLDVKSSIAGWLVGPQAAVELNVVDTEAFALSIEPEGWIWWGFGNHREGGTVRLSAKTSTSRFNVNVGVFNHRVYTRDNANTSDINEFALYDVIEVPVKLGFDVQPSDVTVWRVYAMGNAVSFSNGSPAALVGFNWNHSVTEDLRLSLGAGVIAGGGYGVGFDEIDANLPDLVVLPYPTIEIWWAL